MAGEYSTIGPLKLYKEFIRKLFMTGKPNGRGEPRTNKAVFPKE
jgi:hypothetical protein